MTMLVRPGSGRPSDSKVLRPIRMGWLRVSALKWARSSGRRQGRRFSMPMTPFLASAAMTLILGLFGLMTSRLLCLGTCPSTGSGRTVPRFAPTHHLRLAAHSHRHRRLDRRVRVVAAEGEILEAEGEDVAHLRIQRHRRQRARLAGELLARLVEVVEIQVGVAQSVDGVARLEP